MRRRLNLPLVERDPSGYDFPIMILGSPIYRGATLVLGLSLSIGPATDLVAQDDRPELTLRARPNAALAPAEIVFIGRLRGGKDDHEEFYCLNAEWDWGDGTISQSSFDCEPYEPGTSEIRRRFSRRHSYRTGGRYQIRLHLKRGNETIETARTNVMIQGGILPG